MILRRIRIILEERCSHSLHVENDYLVSPFTKPHILRRRLLRPLDEQPHVRTPIVASDFDVAHGLEAQLRVDLDLHGHRTQHRHKRHGQSQNNINETHVRLVGRLDDERRVRLRGLE